MVMVMREIKVRALAAFSHLPNINVLDDFHSVVLLISDLGYEG